MSAVPPFVGARSVGDLGLCLQPESLEIATYPRQADGIEIEREHLDIGKLENMGCFSAWSGARIEHTLTIACTEQGCSVLCACVLNRSPTLLEAGQLAHRHRVIQQQGTRFDFTRSHARRLESRLHLSNIASSAIDAYGHRRMSVACVQERLPPLRVIVAYTIDPPLGVAPLRGFILVNSFEQILGTAHSVAQDAVGYALEARGKATNSFDGLIDDYVGLFRAALKPCQRNQQNCAYAVWQRLG